MPVLGTEMRRGIPIDVLGIRVCTCHQQCLDDCEVTSNAGDMQGCSEIFSPCIYHCSILNQNLNKAGVSLTCRDMHGCPPISVCTVNT